ncbi:-like antibiotic response protein [Lasallia pustulata]|uniref:-like antibiotic response protein n=1 Tax=Lasallia pustulata TaxID=136370 RepID=A0A1W5CRQ5_9LECA|nr:-like antibiotic response protein [Lasallia pustulata]
MWGFDESQDAHQQVYGQGGGDGGFDNQAKFSHELIAGGAAFEGFKLFEDKQRKEGKPVSHAFAKELLAGIVGGEVDKLAETKGMDEWDKEKAHRKAKENAENMYDQHYVNDQGADNYDPNQYGPPRHFQRDDY